MTARLLGRLRRVTPDEWGSLALLAAWVGLSGPWIAHPAAALAENALNLAEWATFLNEVRGGAMRVVPEILRLAAALEVVAWAVGLAWVRPAWARWALRLLAVPIIIQLIPPYPFFLQAFWSESYGGRFAVALAGALGLAACLLSDRLAPRLRRLIGAGLCGAALASAGWAYPALLGPFQALYAEPLPPGWGALAFGAGLLAALTAALAAAWSQPGLASGGG